MASKAKLPITYGPASAALGAKVRVTAGNKTQVLSQVEWKAFKAVADALEIPLKKVEKKTEDVPEK